ncbi:hypothetical protein [Streptomyces sp. MUM 178J]|uniref:hypothetical protein n=1 Tax=Streptomyces sp. MUM 178J TaxID=2791991 RepID=UPI001F038473|nr:hypothetical protein [Streptomyces sp. MUM 178J]WRQ79063.1 hypothetical protein I3F59_006540 [Streptomyces sp. MUM 178J]
MMRNEQGTPLRLLPWASATGGPCYLSAEDSASRMSRLADKVEADLLASAAFVLSEARPLLAEPATEARELRFAGVRLAEALGDALRIASSRGMRLESK